MITRQALSLMSPSLEAFKDDYGYPLCAKAQQERISDISRNMESGEKCFPNIYIKICLSTSHFTWIFACLWFPNFTYWSFGKYWFTELCRPSKCWHVSLQNIFLKTSLVPQPITKYWEAVGLTVANVKFSPILICPWNTEFCSWHNCCRLFSLEYWLTEFIFKMVSNKTSYSD